MKAFIATALIMLSTTVMAAPQTMEEYVNEKLAKKCSVCSENVTRAMAESDWKAVYITTKGSPVNPNELIDVEAFKYCDGLPACGRFSEPAVRYRPVRSYHYR